MMLQAYCPHRLSSALAFHTLPAERTLSTLAGTNLAVSKIYPCLELSNMKASTRFTHLQAQGL